MPIAPKPLQIDYRALQITVYCRDCGTYLDVKWNDAVKGEIAVEPCQCKLNEIRKVYEQYKHMDRAMTDPILFEGVDVKFILMNKFWQAIKAVCEPEPDEGGDDIGD